MAFSLAKLYARLTIPQVTLVVVLVDLNHSLTVVEHELELLEFFVRKCPISKYFDVLGNEFERLREENNCVFEVIYSKARITLFLQLLRLANLVLVEAGGARRSRGSFHVHFDILLVRRVHLNVVEVGIVLCFLFRVVILHALLMLSVASLTLIIFSFGLRIVLTPEWVHDKFVKNFFNVGT